MTNAPPNLSDIVKGTPKGDEAVKKALIGAARDQEALLNRLINRLEYYGIFEAHEIIEAERNKLKEQTNE